MTYRATVHDKRTAALRGLRPKLRESLYRFSPHNSIDLCHSRRPSASDGDGGRRVNSRGRAQRLVQDDDWHRSCRAYLRTKHHPAAFNRAARPDSYANPDTEIPVEYHAVYAGYVEDSTEWECEGEGGTRRAIATAHHTDDVSLSNTHNQVL